MKKGVQGLGRWPLSALHAPPLLRLHRPSVDSLLHRFERGADGPGGKAPPGSENPSDSFRDPSVRV